MANAFARSQISYAGMGVKSAMGAMTSEHDNVPPFLLEVAYHNESFSVLLDEDRLGFITLLLRCTSLLFVALHMHVCFTGSLRLCCSMLPGWCILTSCGGPSAPCLGILICSLQIKALHESRDTWQCMCRWSCW